MNSQRYKKRQEVRKFPIIIRLKRLVSALFSSQAPITLGTTLKL